jgi:dipeptidyl aminopeptidase/acylaminoacyl peptidase
VKFAFRVDSASLVTAKQIRAPDASPDGKLFAFTAFDRVWIMDAPNSTPRRLTTSEQREFHPVWSPDGKWVAFVTWDDAGGGQIVKAPVGVPKAQPVQLTRAAALYYNLAWSPDGRRIVATRGPARELKSAPDIFFGPLGGQFVWVPSEGGTVNLIAPTGTRDVAHFRTDEPNRIYAYSPLEGLVSFRWDGTDVRQHLKVLGIPGIPTFQNPLEDDAKVLPRRVFPLVLEPEEQRRWNWVVPRRPIS